MKLTEAGILIPLSHQVSRVAKFEKHARPIHQDLRWFKGRKLDPIHAHVLGSTIMKSLVMHPLMMDLRWTKADFICSGLAVGSGARPEVGSPVSGPVHL